MEYVFKLAERERAVLVVEAHPDAVLKVMERG